NATKAEKAIWGAAFMPSLSHELLRAHSISWCNVGLVFGRWWGKHDDHRGLQGILCAGGEVCGERDNAGIGGGVREGAAREIPGAGAVADWFGRRASHVRGRHRSIVVRHSG